MPERHGVVSYPGLGAFISATYIAQTFSHGILRRERRCVMGKPSSIRPGDRFGKLVAVEYRGIRSRRAVWLCRCDCGITREMITDNLKRAKSCGCDRKGNRTHGLRKSPEYMVWWAMRSRCHRPSSRGFKDYGGRGITVCDRWRQSFVAFHEDMGPRPSPQHTIERIDNNRGYEPDNCRWATKDEQQHNTRQNRLVTYNGLTLCVAEWAGRLGIKAATLCARLDAGWPVEKAFVTPVRRWGRCPNDMV